MAYGVTPSWADFQKPPEPVWQGSFTATDLDGTLRAATRAIRVDSFAGFSALIKNSGANPLTDLKCYPGNSVDANGDIDDLPTTPSDLVSSAFSRSNVGNPAGLPANTAMTLTFDLHPMGSKYIQFYAQAADLAKTNLVTALQGVFS